MRGRAWLGVLVGVLLPVPLLAVLVATRPETRPVHHVPVNISPVLSFEERMQRTTFLRRCEKSVECEAPLGCLRHWRLATPVCMDSDCLTDAQCDEGMSCQWLETEGSGPRIGMCAPQGVRQEGERCKSLPTSRDDACAPGLRCFERWCGRTCRAGAPESCPPGFFCAEEGAMCLPTCEARGCPEGQQCVRLNNRAGEQHGSTCVTVHGSNCQQSVCSEGQRCLVFDVPQRPGEVWMACRQRCGEGRPACPEGLLCNRLFCRQPCDPQVHGGCGSGEKCAQSTPEEPWVCQPDW